MTTTPEFRESCSRFGEAWSDLELGITEEQAIALFGKEPALKLPFWENTILYFEDPMFENYPSHYTQYQKKEITEISEIPDVYAAVQLLFNKDGGLVAYTRNGETQTIRTITGEYPGDNLNSIHIDTFRDITK